MSENDPVRLAAFSGGRDGLRLTATRFHRRREVFAEFRPFLAAVRCGGAPRLAAATAELLSERRPPGIVIVVSDFLVNAADYEEALAQLLAARHEVKALHVMGEREAAGVHPPGAYRIRDCETGEVRDVTLGPATVQACRARATRHAERVRDFCARRSIAHAQAFGAAHADEIIRREFPRLGVIA
jgi:hypothetical protein